MLAAEVHPDGVAILRLDRPERRNALSVAMRAAIYEAPDSPFVPPN
jgi:enoyl-CoA hydratase/carnithine racemase